MSVFTNSRAHAAETAAQYVTATLELLGDRNARDVLGSTEGELRRLINGLSAADLAWPEAEGKWSIRDVLQHLADNEIVWGFRVRLTLAHDCPPLTGWDQDLWAARLNYADGDAFEALELFALLRRATLKLIDRAVPADFHRVALHAERGEQTFDQIVKLNAGHDLIHLRQIARIRASQ